MKVRLSQNDAAVLFDFQNPDWSLLNPRTVAESLSRQARFNGNICTSLPHSNQGAFYSVAQHAVLCATTAYRLGYTSAQIRACFHHDDVECVTGDIVSPIKKMFPDLINWINNLEKSYATYMGISNDNLMFCKVSFIDNLIYTQEHKSLFPIGVELSDAEEKLYSNNAAALEVFVPWPHQLAEIAYLTAHSIIEAGNFETLKNVVFEMNAATLEQDAKYDL